MKTQDHSRQIPIPEDWTPEQATAVLEFLITIADAVLRNLREEIEHYSHREANGPFPQNWDQDCSIRNFLFPHIP